MAVGPSLLPTAPRMSGTPSPWRSRTTNNSLLVGVFLAFWQFAVAVFAVPKYLLPRLSDIVSTLMSSLLRYVSASLYTGMEALIGLAFAIILGLGMAVAISWWRLGDRILAPYLVLLQVIPTISIASLLTIWLGYGIEPKIAAAFLTSFFPIVITAAVGCIRVLA